MQFGTFLPSRPVLLVLLTETQRLKKAMCDVVMLRESEQRDLHTHLIDN